MHVGPSETSAFLPGRSFYLSPLGICQKALEAELFRTHWEGTPCSVLLCEGRERALQIRAAEMAFFVASFPHSCPHLTLAEHLPCASDKEQARPHGFESAHGVYS